MYRTRSSTKKYDQVRRTQSCPFCQPDPSVIVAETPHAYILRNNFPYDAWDNQSVLEHLLVVPKKHVTALDELSVKEQTALIKIYSDYGRQGYDVYARAVGNVQRSLSAHQHTHLIRLNGRQHKLFFYLAKPYWLVKR